MCRWSRLGAFLVLAIPATAFAEGRATPGHVVSGRTAEGRPSVGPGVVPNPGQLPSIPTGPGVVPNPGQLRIPGGAGADAGRRFRRGPGGTILVGDQFGFTTYGGNVLPEEGPDEGPDGALPPPIVIPGIGPRPPCVAPRIIRIGRGLEHRARTRVVYGTPSPCSYP